MKVPVQTREYEGSVAERVVTQPPVYPPAPQSGDEWRRLSARLRRRTPAILFGLVLVLSAVTAFTLIWPRTYQSAALIVIEQRTGGDDASLSFLGQLGRATQIETEIELIKSRHVMERVVDQLDLHASIQPLDPTPASFLDWTIDELSRVLPGGPPELRPSIVFPSFDARPDAAPGVYSIGVAPGGGMVIRDATTERVIAASTDSSAPAVAGAAYQFGGVSLSAPDSRTPWPSFLLRVAPFADAVGATRDRVRVSRKEREADLIEVRCEERSPDGARELCQAVVDNYMRLRTDLRRAEATATASFLREQTNLLDQRLTVAEDSLESYRARNHAVALGERAAEEVRQSTQLMAQRDQLEAERTALSGFIAQIQSGGNGTARYRDLASFPTFLQNPAVTQLMASLVSLENERGDLLLRRAETSTEVTALDARISASEQQLLSVGQSYLRALDAQIGSLDGALRSVGGRLAQIPHQEVEADRLQRQASLLNDLSGLLKTRLREAEVAEAVNLPNVRVVDQASLSQSPAHPKLRPNLALGAVLGLAFGLMLALYREGTDSRVRERGDVEREFALPVLATIPRLSGAVSILPVPALRRPNDEARLLTGRSESSHRISKTRLIARQAFRTLATDLWFATRSRNDGGTVVAVTSAGQGEGKTFVACNLALARASQGARTILIDGDVRGGGATKFFGLPPSLPGLSDILTGNPAMYGEGEDGVWEKRVWVGLMNHAQLWVIPPGTASLYSARFNEFAALLEQFKSRFDMIVIDAPPMNLAADTVPIAAVSDAVLVVARGALTTRDSLKLTLERLGRTRSHVIGAVLNDVKPTRDADEAYEYSGTEEVLT